MWIPIAVVVIYVFLRLYFPYLADKYRRWKHPPHPFPDEWRAILGTHVSFYFQLNKEEKLAFEHQVHRFIHNVKISGNNCEVEVVHRLLVAASATIPVFAYEEWEYTFLNEVVLYPSAFEFPGEGPYKGRKMNGVVGGGKVLTGKMLLSMEALFDGFKNDVDKRNVAIHEFMHLIDKEDGKVDGLPEKLLKRQFTLPWLHLMMLKIGEIRTDNSDIRKYGANNPAEFLAVVSEYFFERPHELRQKHPRLYATLSEIFRQHPHKRKVDIIPKRKR